MLNSQFSAEDTLVVLATIRSEQALDQAMVDVTANALSDHLNRPVTLEVITSPIVRSRGSP